jgi:hypothetical protein
MSFEPGLIVFSGCLIIKRLVRPDVVICFVPVFQLVVVFNQRRADIFDFIKLLSMGPVGSLHKALQLRRPGRNDKKPDSLGPTGLLKVLLKL